MNNPVLTAKGANDPITLANAKSAKKITSTAEDTTSQRMLDAAIDLVEHGTGKALTQNTYVLRLQSFSDTDFVEGGVIKLPWVPLVSVTQIQYVDTDGATQTLSTDVYEYNIYACPGEIRLKSGQSWPSVNDQFNPITITYQAGYNNTGVTDTVPEKLVQAIELIFGEWFVNREDYAGRRLPKASEVLIQAERVIW